MAKKFPFLYDTRKMASPPSTTAQRISLFFTKTHSTLYRRLSRNILREVCSYLGNRFLPVIHASSFVVLHDLEAGTQYSALPSGQFIYGGTYCIISDSLLMYVGNGGSTAAKKVNFRTGAVTDAPHMAENRAHPGAICFESTVFVFGGGFRGQTLNTCEAFSLARSLWTHCPDMTTGKVQFTPVEHSREIYLTAVQCAEGHLEVFTPATRRYRLLPLRFQANSTESVSFIYAEELFIIHSRRVLAWKLDSQEKEARTIGEFRNNFNARSSGCPVHYRHCVYWATLEGTVVEFDFTKKQFSGPEEG